MSDGLFSRSGSSSGESHVGFAEVDRGDRRYLAEESGVFDGPRVAGSYQSWSRANDAIDYVGTSWRRSHTESELADGTALSWTYDNEFRYTGVGEFHAASGESGVLRPEGETGLAYSGVAATFTTTYGEETTFHTSTTVPTRTFSYPMGSMTYTYTMPGWSSWNEHHGTVESEARFDAGWITWVRYSPTESTDFGEEGEARTETHTGVSRSSYTGPAGHLFEQSFGSWTTTSHTSATTGTPPSDAAVIAAMNALANQSVGESASGGGSGAWNTTANPGEVGSAAAGVVAAKDLNLAEYFSQSAAQPTCQSASKSAGRFAVQGGAAASEPSTDLPARHPDSAMPESWLDALASLADRAKTAHDDPGQLAAATDAAFAELNAMDDPQNPGTPIVQTCSTTEGGGAPASQLGASSTSGGWAFWNWDWSPVWKKYKEDLGFFTDVFARMFTGRSRNDPEIQQGREYLNNGEYGKAAQLVITDSANTTAPS